MSDFKKPETTFVHAKEYLGKILDYPLRKDLCENEMICPTCHGCGVIIVDRRYGLSDDPDRKSYNLFPYNHQTMALCPNCYNGVVKVCKYCGQIIPRSRLKCLCDAQQEEDRKALEKKEKESLNKLPELPDDEVNKLEYMYSDYYPYNNGYFSEWEDFFDAACDDDELVDGNRPEYVYPAREEKLRIDAERVIDEALENWFEEACDYISDSEIKELQDYLDSWCKKCGAYTSYMADYKYKIRIPWEEYDKGDS